MLALVPLQILDSFLLNYHFGHVFAVMLVLSVVGVLPTGSKRALSLNVAAFGLLFLLTPFSMMGGDAVWKLLGLALVVVAPMVYALAEE